MVNNQLPPCTFSETEYFQWWAFIQVKRHPGQTLDPKWGCLSHGGPTPRTYGNSEIGALQGKENCFVDFVPC